MASSIRLEEFDNGRHPALLSLVSIFTVIDCHPSTPVPVPLLSLNPPSPSAPCTVYIYSYFALNSFFFPSSSYLTSTLLFICFKKCLSVSSFPFFSYFFFIIFFCSFDKDLEAGGGPLLFSYSYFSKVTSQGKYIKKIRPSTRSYSNPRPC